VLVYLPFCLFNIASPLMTLLIGVTGWRIVKLGNAEAQPDVLAR
jgi:NhaC family Na+:H+ antiporter